MLDPSKEVPLIFIASAFTGALFGIDAYTAILVSAACAIAVVMSPRNTFLKTLFHFLSGTFFSFIVVSGIHKHFPDISLVLIAGVIGFSLPYYWYLILKNLELAWKKTFKLLYDKLEGLIK